MRLDAKQNCMELFFNYPMKQFHVRELGRKIQVNTKTVMHYLKELNQENIVKKVQKKGIHTYYEPNRLSKMYNYHKRMCEVKNVLQSGLIEYIEKQVQPKAIILYGSIWWGTYDIQSDIDIFIQGDAFNVNLAKYELQLNRNIHILFEKTLEKLSKGLLNNIQSGYILSGALRFEDGKLFQHQNLQRRSSLTTHRKN